MTDRLDEAHERFEKAKKAYAAAQSEFIQAQREFRDASRQQWPVVPDGYDPSPGGVTIVHRR